MVTAKQLEKIFKSDHFHDELEEISHYAANIKQERPIAYLLCKLLQKDRESYYASLEKKHKDGPKHDIFLDGMSIELKFHYDFDMEKLKEEMVKCEGNIDKLKEGIDSGKTNNWNIAPCILKDTIGKKADIFIWIISQRTFSGSAFKDKNITDYINLYDEQKRYNKKENSTFLKIAKDFLSEINKKRKFKETQLSVKTNRIFQNDYHIFICQFL